MAKRGYLKSKTIHHSPTDCQLQGFFFVVKYHLSICKVTQKQLINIL